MDMNEFCIALDEHGRERTYRYRLKHGEMRKVALACGISRQRICDITAGRVRPSQHLAELLSAAWRACGVIVSAKAFRDPAERINAPFFKAYKEYHEARMARIAANAAKKSVTHQDA